MSCLKFLQTLTKDRNMTETDPPIIEGQHNNNNTRGTT